MNRDEMFATAVERVRERNQDGSNFRASRGYENLLYGKLVSVAFDRDDGKEDYNHVHFGVDDVIVYRFASEVLDAISHSHDKNAFIRFTRTVGLRGFIASALVVLFSLLLFALVFKSGDSAGVIEIVKTSFTLILGFFFGSQATKTDDVK